MKNGDIMFRFRKGGTSSKKVNQNKTWGDSNAWGDSIAFDRVTVTVILSLGRVDSVDSIYTRLLCP